MNQFVQEIPFINRIVISDSAVGRPTRSVNIVISYSFIIHIHKQNHPHMINPGHNED